MHATQTVIYEKRSHDQSEKYCILEPHFKHMQAPLTH